MFDQLLSKVDLMGAMMNASPLLRHIANAAIKRAHSSKDNKPRESKTRRLIESLTGFHHGAEL